MLTAAIVFSILLQVPWFRATELLQNKAQTRGEQRGQTPQATSVEGATVLEIIKMLRDEAASAREEQRRIMDEIRRARLEEAASAREEQHRIMDEIRRDRREELDRVHALIKTSDLSGWSLYTVKLMQSLSWISLIPDHERLVFSQHGEDGVIEYIFDNIGAKEKRYVEFGTENGSQCNTRNLWLNHGWDGLLLDGSGNASDGRVIHHHIILAENIVEIFQKYNVNKRVDLQSIDIDMNDLYVQKEIWDAGYRPRVVVCEYNRNFAIDESFSIKYNKTNFWDPQNPTAFFGVSALAWKRFANKYGYSLVHLEKNGVNAFFVHRSVMVEYLASRGFSGIEESDIVHLLPPFEAIYRRNLPLHPPYTFKKFYEGMKLHEWTTVLENGDVVPFAISNLQKATFP